VNVFLLVNVYACLFIAENGGGSGVGQGGDVLMAARLFFQDAGNVSTPGTGVAVRHGSEELVGLEDEFASQPVLVVYQNN